jgi:hypothetical protein
MNMIPSKKIYQLVSLEEYNFELQQCIKGLSQNYEQQSMKKKWDLLLATGIYWALTLVASNQAT